MSIYKPCDIRGHAATELSPELYHCWGRALGEWVEPAAKFVVGGDVRASTPPLLGALVEGLCTSGADVVVLGQLPTPMIYHALRRLRAGGCAIVTASHNPAPINGLKWTIGRQSPAPEDVEKLRCRVESGCSREDRRRSTARELDISFDYVACLQEMWIDAMGAQCHVVLDPMHGCWSARARRYLQAVFPQCLFTSIHDRPDGAFGGRMPDCSRAELLAELGEAVYRQRAHLGIAFDGDGDRVAFVDETGTPLGSEEATWLLLQSFGAGLAGQRFVHDVKFSDCVPRAACQLGAEAVIERSGHAFLRTRVFRDDALFGAEVSGHYFYRDLEGGDDGLLTACRMIAYLAQQGQPLGQLRRQCPPVFITPDFHVPLEPRRQENVFSQVRKTWADCPQVTIDGVRIETPDGWALVRSSVTEPALSFRFESSGWDALDDWVRRFCRTVPEVGEELWGDYQAAMR